MRSAVIAVTLALLLATTAFAELRADFMEIGQADATLIVCDGTVMLVDAGANATGQQLVEQLRQRGIQRIDVMVGTHPHEDHIGGMDEVINAFDIGVVLMPDVDYATQTYLDVLIAMDRKGIEPMFPDIWDSFKLGGATVTVLSPARNDYADLNFFSLVFRIDHGETSMLLMADAEDVNEFEMIDAGMPLDADILKVGHHGSNTSTTEAFVDAVKPAIAIISCGKANSYGHPDTTVVERLIAAGCEIFITHEDGDIVITSDGVNYDIATNSIN